jgi:hypothetical protein
MKKRQPELPLGTIKERCVLFSMWSALEGEPEILAARLRRGEASKEEMALAADLIEKKIKPRRARSRRVERLAIADSVGLLKREYPEWQHKRIISEVIKILKPSIQHISERHVYNALEEFDGKIAQIRRMTMSKSTLAYMERRINMWLHKHLGKILASGGILPPVDRRKHLGKHFLHESDVLRASVLD